MSATLFDVCERCGVSTATVSRVVNGSPLVHERTRRKVLKAIRELGYRPSHAARSLARQRCDILGVIFPQNDSDFFTEVLRGIDEAASGQNFHLMAAFAHGELDEQQLVSDFLKDRMVDALILMNLLLPEGFVRKAANSGMPIVLIDRPMSGTNVFTVSVDNAAGARAGMRHLLQKGCQSIAILDGPHGSFDAEERLEACRAAAKEGGVPLPDEMIWSGAFTEASGRMAVERWLKKKRELPDAIFALNDDMAVGAWEVLKEKGYKVPGDVAIMGFDDIRVARHLGLTTVRVPALEMGKAAARAAVNQVVTGESDRHQLLDVELVVRESA